jgi:hypothetical protein
MKYELVNLNLGENPVVRQFSVGHFQIKLADDYDKLQPELAALGQQQHTIASANGEVTESIIQVSPKAGKTLITAVAQCEQEPVSVFCHDNAKGVWDLCMILSFLLGRRVFLPEEARYNTINHFGCMVIPYYQIHQAAAIAWSNRQNFKTASEQLPLWYYLSMNDTSIEQVKLLLGCVSLEIIQGLDEHKNEECLSQESSSELAKLESLIGVIQKLIDHSDLDPGKKNALKSAVGKWGGSGLQETFKRMLEHYGLIDSQITGIPLKRVESINKMRNGVVHRGKLDPPTWVTDDESKNRVGTFIRARFIPALVLEYLNRKFGLHQFNHVKRNTQMLKEYLYNGTYEGHQIDES